MGNARISWPLALSTTYPGRGAYRRAYAPPSHLGRAAAHHRGATAHARVNKRQGRSTSTSNFGVGAREGHDASAFYARFSPKPLSMDHELAEPFELRHPLVCGDSGTWTCPTSRWPWW